MGRLRIYYNPPATAGGTDLITDASHAPSSPGFQKGRISMKPFARAHGVFDTSLTTSSTFSASITENPASRSLAPARDSLLTSRCPSQILNGGNRCFHGRHEVPAIAYLRILGKRFLLLFFAQRIPAGFISICKTQEFHFTPPIVRFAPSLCWLPSRYQEPHGAQ